MFFKKTWLVTKKTFSEFAANKVPKLSAALAYYTIFSLPGLLIIVIWISDIFYGQAAVEGTVYAQISDLIGKEAAIQVQETLRNAMLSTGSGWAAAGGIATLILGASGVFSEVQDSINQVWHLKAKAKKGRGLIKLVMNRLISFSMVIVLGFLLLVSLIVNGIMEIFIDRLSGIFPQAIVIYIFNLVFSFIVTVILFGAIFKVLPDARIKWKHVIAGAIATAVLFMVGKFLISLYLGHSKVSSTYGAAGSIVVVLLWVYYSAIILYLGAVFTRVYAEYKGARIYPSRYAVWVEEKEVESKQSLDKKPKEKK